MRIADYVNYRLDCAEILEYCASKFMKILLTGSIHVGKTTLLERLKSNSPRGVAYIPELARELMKSRPDLANVPGKDGILPGLGDYHFAEQTRRETDASLTGSRHIVCDRGIVDLVTHTRIFGGRDRQHWLDWTRSYDKIYLMETTGITLDSTGYPPGRDWHKFRDQLDAETRKLLDEQQLEYFCLRGPLDGKETILRSLLEGGSGNIEGASSRLER